MHFPQLVLDPITQGDIGYFSRENRSREKHHALFFDKFHFRFRPATVWSTRRVDDYRMLLRESMGPHFRSRSIATQTKICLSTIFSETGTTHRASPRAIFFGIML